MAINRIDHAALRVADLTPALDWYEGILGMTVLDRSAERVHLACQGESADLTLHVGGQSVKSLALGVDDEGDFDEIEHRLSQAGIAHERYTDPDRPGHGAILGTTIPSGQRLEFVVGAGGRVAGKTQLTGGGGVGPTDIDHVTLLGDVSPAVIDEFFTVVLGLKHTLKMVVAGNYAGTWIRATQTDHDIAYLGAQRKTDRLHHVAFNVEDGNHYFRLSDRLAENGLHWEMGPGRHLAVPRDIHGRNSNNFAYAFDPTGNRNEFCSDMALLPDDSEVLELDLQPEDLGLITNGWNDLLAPTFYSVGS